MRKALERQDARSRRKLGSVERLASAVDERDVDAIVAALSSHHATHGTQNPSVEPLLVLRDPSCATTLLHALLRLPTVTRSWPGFAATLMTVLEHRQMAPAAVCALVEAELPAHTWSAEMGAATALLRWGRYKEASSLARAYCDERSLRFLVLETLAEQDADAKNDRLFEVRTEFMRQGAKNPFELLIAEAHCTADPDKRDKLLRHLVVDYRATSFDTPQIQSMPREGSGPFRLFLVLADAHRRELPQIVSMAVISESEEDAKRWARIFVPSATSMEVVEVMTVDAPTSGLCLPWGPVASHHQDERLPIEDWTGLATLRRLQETNMPFPDILAFARTGVGPPNAQSPRPSYTPPVYQTMLETGYFESMGW